MKTILFTWELGSGLGHINNLLPLVLAFKKRGITLSVHFVKPKTLTYITNIKSRYMLRQ